MVSPSGETTIVELERTNGVGSSSCAITGANPTVIKMMATATEIHFFTIFLQHALSLG